MKHKSLLAVFALITVCLPFLGAQVADEPKTPEPKVEKAKGPTLPSEDVVKAGFTWRGRIQDVRSDDKGREALIAPVDPQKEQELALWAKKEEQSIARDKNQAARIPKYRQEYQKKIAGIFAGEPKSVHLTDTIRIRTKFVPPAFDATGTPKKLTPFDISKLKSSKLPGYAADGSSLRSGQLVIVYEPKRDVVAKVAPAKTKDFIGVDPNLNSGNTVRVDALMIYVTDEGK